MTQGRSGTTTGSLFESVGSTPAVHSLLRRLEKGGVLSCHGVSAGAQPFLAVLLQKAFPDRPIVVVTEGVKAQEFFHQNAETWTAFHNEQAETKLPHPLFYPAWEVLPHESKLPHADVVAERLETLIALGANGHPVEPGSAGVSPARPPVKGRRDAGAPRKGSGQPRMVVTSVAALLQRTLPLDECRRRTRVLKRGDRLEPLDLIEWLEEQAYEPEAQVTQKGAINLRGGIVDVFPITSPWPVRLEFFGNELESLRYFDPLTQISREEISEVTLSPGGEFGILKQLVERGGTPATLLDYLPGETVLVLCEPEQIDEQAGRYAEQIPEGDPFFISWAELRERAGEQGMVSVAFSEASSAWEIVAGESERADEMPLEFTGLELFRPLAERTPEVQVADAQRREFFAQLQRWLRQGYEIRVFCNNEGERQRFEEIWQEYGFGRANESPGRRDGRPALHLGTLSRGFLHEPAKLVVVTDAEIFGRYKVQRPRRLKSPHAAATRSALDINFAEVEPDDFVVHLQHGIGRFVGLQPAPATFGRKGAATDSEKVADNRTECLVIEYAPGDPTQAPPRLYVPVTEAHLVSKYVGAGKVRPQLNTLGGTRWSKTKAQAENAVRDLAGELLAIQAARESQSGYALAPDTPWQREFESAFLYEETPDQMSSIAATKSDMESRRPMDRLICGDVGFGKTEVAIRAVFKAVMSGRQAAVLVPTTVLAQQHFNTFRERMADYPVRIELLSRFRTRREQERVLRDLATGAVDIVIGTHRLVQNDVAFKDLGLVVIDEEQRFGVMHKEKFKMLRRLVDVLTLSATPIPRTLYLALTGARDMSTIETPPQDRLPVETIVAQYDERVIRDAIQRELNRNGQVFYLHNRVFDIESVAHRLRALVPHARIVVGHGQMNADDLEEVMTKFVNGEADVLLSTTIIESGIDIPNANTILIDRADRFGLSDLYQLRGRVGRYKHQAYAYLLLPRHAGLLTDARKRISAIKQYSSLGSGFKIAMRDLEIRGAGNLLGAEQSGHITAVGFELYCQLLKQSIGALKGEKVKPRIDVQVRLDFLAMNPAEEVERAGEPRRRKREPDLQISIPREVAVYAEAQTAGSDAAATPARKAPAYIPLNYIPEAQHRIEVYRKLAQTTDKAGLESLQKEVRDRFGPLPAAMEMLLKATGIKLLAADHGVTVVETREDKLMLTRNNDFIMPGGRFPRLSGKDPNARLKEIRRLLLSL